MALMDIFYPGNPGRREAVIRTHQQILDCLENSYDTANDLVLVLNQHCEAKLLPIKYHNDMTIKDACDTFLARIEEIKDEVAKYQKQLECKLGTDAFQKLSGIMESSNEGFEKARGVIPAVEGVCGVIASVAATFFIKQVVFGALSSTLCRCMAIVGASFAGTLVVGVIALGIDAIISAIVGAIERDNLEKTLAEYNKYLEELEPATKAFQKSVIEVRVRIEMNSK